MIDYHAKQRKYDLTQYQKDSLLLIIAKLCAVSVVCLIAASFFGAEFWGSV